MKRFVSHVACMLGASWRRIAAALLMVSPQLPGGALARFGADEIAPNDRAGAYATGRCRAGFGEVRRRMRAGWQGGCQPCTLQPTLRRVVEALWKAPVPSGEWRYYDGTLCRISTMHLSGELRARTPR